jgi:tetratricopeptide (TPR) repeat protein
MKPMYIHLTTHSAFSLQEGLSTPTDLVQAAQAMNMPALGLTDRNLLTGVIEFATACREANIQPIIGLEVHLNDGPVSLFATSPDGWSCLCRLSSAINLREDPDAPCTLDMLAACASDLIALSKHPQLLKEIFPDRLYVNLQDPSEAEYLSTLARQLGLPTVVTHPIYYLTPEQATLQRTLTAVRLGKTVSTLAKDAPAPADAYFLTAQQMEDRFREYPEAIAATAEIAERCKFDLPIGGSQMPKVPLPNGVSAAQHLREKATQGALQLYGEITHTIQERLDHELEIIARMGFEPIFLIVEDVLNFARQRSIPFSSRGSAASSLVAHCLGITGPDPLRLNLYFERFLNPARTTPPDIDTDLCSRRRDQVIQHVFDTYGADRVAVVGTINRYRPKSALNDVAKAHGLEPAKVRELSNQLPHSFWMHFATGPDGKPAPPFAALRAAYPSAGYQTIFDEAEAILKLPRHQTLQAAIDWSYNLLSPAEQILFRRSSIFAGGWTLEAAESVCSDQDIFAKDGLKAEDILRLLTQLINKSLVATEEQNGEVRYHMLETIRRYAGDKLLTSGESEGVRDRHLDFFIRFAETADPKLRSAEQLAWFDRVETEHDNLRIALEWSLESGKSDHALRLGGALGYFWEFRGAAREGCKWLDEALVFSERERAGRVAAGETLTRAEIMQHAKALYADGRLHFLTFFDPTKGRTMIEDGLRISREIGDIWQTVVALEHLGWIAILEGDAQTARTHLEQGILLARELEDRWPLALCLLRLTSPLMRTDAPIAQQVAEQGVTLARSLGDQYLLSYGLTQLAAAYFMNGNYTDAVPILEEVLVKAPPIGGGYINLSLFLLVVFTSLLGDAARAKSYCFQLLAHVRETGFAVGIALIALGWLASYNGWPELSVHLLAATEVAFHQSSINLNTYGGPILMIYKQALEKAQAQLDPMTFAFAFAEGQKMPSDQALDLALKIIEEL